MLTWLCKHQPHQRKPPRQEDAAAYFAWGVICTDFGDYPSALANYTRAIELDPDNAMVYCTRGLVCANLKDYSAALADYTYAIELDPHLAQAYHYHGYILADLKNYSAALADLNHAVALKYLSEMPVLERQDANVLDKQWAALRGAYSAGINFLYSAAGMFTPHYLGVVQYYGASAQAASLDEAARQAVYAAQAVEGGLAGSFIQSVLLPPKLEWMEWYLDFIPRAESILTLLGYPDPRQARKGLGKDGEIPDENADDLAQEQNEILFRGLTRLREDFIFQVTSQSWNTDRLSNSLARLTEMASIPASRQRGSVGIGVGVGVPIMASLASAVSGGHSAADAQTKSTTDGDSHGWGTSQEKSYSHPESQSSSVGGGETHTVGESHGKSSSHAEGENWGTTSSHTSGGGGMSGWSASTSVNMPASTHSSGQSQGVTDYSSQEQAISNATGQPILDSPVPAGPSSSESRGAGSVSMPAGSSTQGSADGVGGSVSAGFGGTGASVSAQHSDQTSSTQPR